VLQPAVAVVISHRCRNFGFVAALIPTEVLHPPNILPSVHGDCLFCKVRKK
jgi:hypothetical protein